MLMKIAYSGIVFLLVLLTAVSAQTPAITSYVTDNAGVLSPGFQAELENALAALEQETNGVQFVVYVGKEYPKDYSLEEYTLKIAEENGVGKSGNDNGLLLYIAIDDHEYRWETGYGVESTLSAPLLGRISREYLVPAFKEGNYERGILDVVNVTARILLNAQDADIVKLREEEPRGAGKVRIIVLIIIALMVVAIIVTVLSAIRANKGLMKNRKSWRNDVYTGAAAGIFAPRWGGFGGRGRGGFGGFSGGGGHFGGGGFGGKW